jgi:hypothetical protein
MNRLTGSKEATCSSSASTGMQHAGSEQNVQGEDAVGTHVDVRGSTMSSVLLCSKVCISRASEPLPADVHLKHHTTAYNIKGIYMTSTHARYLKHIKGKTMYTDRTPGYSLAHWLCHTKVDRYPITYSTLQNCRFLVLTQLKKAWLGRKPRSPVELVARGPYSHIIYVSTRIISIMLRLFPSNLVDAL